MGIDSIKHRQIVDGRGDLGWVTDVFHHDEVGRPMSSRLQGVHTKQSADHTLKHFRDLDARIVR